MGAVDGGEGRWVRACARGDVGPGEAVRVEIEPPVAVFNVDGELLATDDTCTHAQSSLADGYVEGDRVECSWHFATFCLRTGEALTLPARDPVRTHEVKVEGDDVYVLVGAAGDHAGGVAATGSGDDRGHGERDGGRPWGG
ncbi:MAG TPA: bifunctional 3-phenylpropionate/cinnamic acid dioxygenase ferredoxin subunit [Acidimicrobiales bacterium]|nr:bifunctional 3-phenylpropionate/cinnamic acid dioxygenase ferredoxin subunit [Acidimicrobiales bacterium]